MSSTAEPFDFLLVLALLVLAWQSLRASDLFSGIVLFMLFGLLTALAWVRLSAPDIALAEAAIGAGLTGALFLGALGRMEEHDPDVALEKIGTVGPLSHGLLIIALSTPVSLANERFILWADFGGEFASLPSGWVVSDGNSDGSLWTPWDFGAPRHHAP